MMYKIIGFDGGCAVTPRRFWRSCALVREYFEISWDKSEFR